jgi:hypothetical protein
MAIDDAKFEQIAAPLPAESRYRNLLRGVLDKLPEGWDEFRTVGVELGAGTPRGLASALRLEAIEDADEVDEVRAEQTWIVTLYPERLDSLSDAAVTWAIAHELGHVASGCRCGEMVQGDRGLTRVRGTSDEYREISPTEVQSNERVADAIGRAWGFWHEEECFERETQTMT